jgi:hypothetical protein
MDAVVVRVQRREIPSTLRGLDAAGERARLVRLGRWLEQIWTEKDALIDSLQAAGPAAGLPRAPAQPS